MVANLLLMSFCAAELSARVDARNGKRPAPRPARARDTLLVLALNSAGEVLVMKSSCESHCDRSTVNELPPDRAGPVAGETKPRNGIKWNKVAQKQ